MNETAINLPLIELCVRRDHNAHVCLEFRRGRRWSEFLAFEPRGLQKCREHTEEFHARFCRTVDITLERAALTLLRSLRRAYLPGDGVGEILLEAYTMAKTDGGKDLAVLGTAELVDYYNGLAKACGLPALSGYKGAKAKLVIRIRELQAKAVRPTTKQEEAKVTQSAQAQKRLEGLKEARDGDGDSDGRGKKTVKAAKAAKAAKATSAKAPKKAGAGRPRGGGLGIGAFCMDLLVRGKSNSDVLSAARTKFPGASTSASSVAWYRNKLLHEGKLRKE